MKMKWKILGLILLMSLVVSMIGGLDMTPTLSGGGGVSGKPDLVIEAITAEDTSFGVIVCNLGYDEIGSYQFEVSVNGKEKILSYGGEPLEHNECSQKIYSWGYSWYNLAENSEYLVKAEIDPNDLIDESNEDNNLKEEFICALGDCSVKLIITDLDLRIDESDNLEHNNLENEDVIIPKANPGSNVEFEFEIKNNYPIEKNIDLENIVIKVTIEDIDNGNDISKMITLHDLGAQESEDDIEISLDIPFLANEGRYTIKIEVSGEDKESIEHLTEWIVYLEVEIDTTPPEIEIFFPYEDSAVQGDFTGLFVDTDESAVCEYSLNGSDFEEMFYTNDYEHYQLITGLQDTTNGNAYNLEVKCIDDYGNSNNSSVSFDVDLSKIEELFILEDIEDYKYLRSTSLDFLAEEDEEVDGMYFAYYEKDDEEDSLYSVAILDVNDLFFEDEFLEEDDGEVSMQIINGQTVYVYDDGYASYLVWFHEDLIIFVMNFSNSGDDIEDMFFMGFDEPGYMDSIPLDLVGAYLEKYPNDVEIEFPNPSLLILSTSNFEITSNGTYEVVVQIANTGNVTFESVGNCDDAPGFCGVQFSGPFDWYPNGIESLEPGESQRVRVVLENPSEYDIGVTILTMGVTAYYLDGDNEEKIEDAILLSLVKPDEIPPTVELISPREDYVKKTDNSSYEIDFEYEVEDESEITYCELIMDDDVEETETNVQRDVENVFSVDLEKGNYDWQIKCVDSEGNEGFSEVRDLRIKKESSSEDSPSEPSSDSDDSDVQPPSDVDDDVEVLTTTSLVDSNKKSGGRYSAFVKDVKEISFVWIVGIAVIIVAILIMIVGLFRILS